MKPKLNFKWLIIVLMLSVLITGCSSAATTTSESASEIAGKSWGLVSMNGVDPLPGITPAVYFGNEFGIVGYTGCNLLTGNYNLSGSQISIENQLSSHLECTSDQTVQEQALILALSSASGYEVNGNELILSNPDQSRVAKFSLLPETPIKGTSWLANSFNSGEGAFVVVLAGSKITANFGEDGVLSGSAGCNNYNTSFEETAGGAIKINGPIASTMMACDQPDGVMEQETQYLTSLPTATKLINLAGVMLLQEDDGTPVALYFTASNE
jgi:heat shock protein HslJ